MTLLEQHATPEDRSDAKASSVENLQKALAMEMTAVHQYLLHAHTLEDWGLDVLAARMRREMAEELGHASRFIDRILFHGGRPDVRTSKPPRQAEMLEDLLGGDLEEEENAICFYAQAALTADEVRDVGTRVLFEEILLDEEGHKDWLARQLDLLERMGEPNYMSQNMSDVARSD